MIIDTHSTLFHISTSTNFSLHSWFMFHIHSRLSRRKKKMMAGCLSLICLLTIIIVATKVRIPINPTIPGRHIFLLFLNYICSFKNIMQYKRIRSGLVS